MSINVLGQSYESEDQALAALTSELERLAAQKRRKEEERLKTLAAEFSLDSVDALIGRIEEFASPGLRRLLAGAGGASVRPKGSRTRVTLELKDGIVAALKAGATAATVATQFGVSLPTVHKLTGNWIFMGSGRGGVKDWERWRAKDGAPRDCALAFGGELSSNRASIPRDAPRCP
ncbi:MAG: hypothetical protein HY736_17570 [Verrucomicrobia bacterium]|nr:hypothetical protein [Verrucomicrobiota bacterium]